MSAAKKYIEANGYEGVKALIEQLPPTWIPALTRKLVECGYSKNVWVLGGCGSFVRTIERDIA